MNRQNRNFQALIGHLVDLYRVAKFNFNNPHSYTKYRAINSLRKRSNAKNFIEIGTYLGVTTKRCAPHFEQVYTVELDIDLANQAAEYLAKNQNVEVIQGDGLELLSKILKRPSIDDALIFLDGHFSEGDTACGDFPEPAVEELRVISQYKHKVSAVIVDDFRLFGIQEGFPSKSALMKSAETYFGEDDYTVQVYLDQLILCRKPEKRAVQAPRNEMLAAKHHSLKSISLEN